MARSRSGFADAAKPGPVAQPLMPSQRENIRLPQSRQAPLAIVLLIEIKIVSHDKLKPPPPPSQFSDSRFAGDRMETRIDSRCAIVSLIAPTSPASPAPCVLLRRIFSRKFFCAARALASAAARPAESAWFLCRVVIARFASPNVGCFGRKDSFESFSNRW